MKSGIRTACEYAETHVDESLKLDVLARIAGMSPFHFLRSFKAAVGVTPKQYVDELRLRRFKTSLKNSQDVTAAVYDAGYGSASRVYERADTRLGMTPAQYRRSGEGVNISYATVDTPLGLMMVAATDRGLCFVQFGENADALLRQLRREYSKADITPMEDANDPPAGSVGRRALKTSGRQPAELGSAARRARDRISNARLGVSAIDTARPSTVVR